MLFGHAEHGFGDLGVSISVLIYLCLAALATTSLALWRIWPDVNLRKAAEGLELPALLQRARGPAVAAGGTVGVLGLLLVLSVAALGRDLAATNLAPATVLVVFWVGGSAASFVVGDFWRLLNPFLATARLADRLRGRAARRPARGPDAWWLPAAALLVFVWYMQAFHDTTSPRSLAVAAGGYTVVFGTAAVAWGAGWIERNEPFAAYFDAIGRAGILGLDRDGQLVLRPPATGLATISRGKRAAGLAIVVIGWIAFDALRFSGFWADVQGDSSGWALTLMSTIGLLWMIGVVAAAYLGVARVAEMLGARPRWSLAPAFSSTLVCIAVGYTLGPFIDRLVFDSQWVFAQLSNPFGHGWDLFGTAARTVDYDTPSATALAWTTLTILVVTHVIALVTVHDSARRRSGSTPSTGTSGTTAIGRVVLPFSALVYGSLILAVSIVVGA
ncbi:MAG: hypothetical protein JJLCMIEE_01967 [Acidimicrobiales bacterium]|nr:MAG: hypothetical protein EDR02_15840 [Actinomycetota bacterium]MBV6508900.1 hypothetical protein [Acidimicrobiales bacterium]RIK03937.1 MAG: hypothetical protein DCC48_14620 [Acidobacteriota bacterium]